MSIDMYVPNSKVQASSVSAFCDAKIEEYEAIKKALTTFASDTIFLKGKGYDSGKVFFQQVLIPLVQGGSLLVELVSEACQKFPDEYQAQVDSGSLKQSELEEKIQQTNSMINSLNHIRETIQNAEIDLAQKGFQLMCNSALSGIYDFAKRELERKLEKLLAFNASSPSIFSEIAAIESAISQGLAQANNSWNTTTQSFVIPSANSMGWKKTIEDAKYTKIAQKKYEAHLKEFPEDLEKLVAIVKYEEKHPEYVKTTDEFLSPLELRDIIGIKYLIYSAKEPYATLCMKYMTEFEITDINTGGVFDSGKNTLVFDVVEDRTNPRGKYYTFFHEIGHAVDYYYAKEHGIEGFFSDGFKYKGLTLTEYNYLDVGNNTEKSMREILSGKTYNHLSESEKQNMVENVKRNLLNQNKDYNSLSVDEQALQKYLAKDYKDILDGAVNNTVSDIYGGVTNLAIGSQYGHYGPEPDGGSYWVKPDGQIRRDPNKESFAGFFGRELVGEPEHSTGLESIRTHLKESEVYMREMIKEMGSDN